jgi:hypothetical protein
MAANTKSTTSTKTKTTTKTATERKPADQALLVVDVAVGAPAVAVDNAKRTVGQLRDSQGRTQEIELLQNRVNNLRDKNTRSAQVETLKQLLTAEFEKAEKRGGDVRRQVTDQVVDQARKARQRVEPVYKDRVEPVYKQRVEPVVKDRVEPVYKQRVEPTVKKVRERTF